MRLLRRHYLALAAAPLVAAPLVAAPVPAFSQELAVGKLLVATRKSRDPDFARSVILLIHYDQQGALGLMVNRPMDVPVAKLFPELKQAKASLYQGGPVVVGVRGLFRSRAKPELAGALFADVYVISNVRTLETMLAADTPSDSFRVYGGSAGWSMQQLKDEVSRGLWRVLPGDAGVVFDRNPATLWSRLAGL